MKTQKEKAELMKKALELFIKLDEEQITLTTGVMTGMLLEDSRKEKQKEKVS